MVETFSNPLLIPNDLPVSNLPNCERQVRYGTENIFETYYTAHLWRGVSIAGDLQHVANPGYNHDRGPALVSSIRIHF